MTDDPPGKRNPPWLQHLDSALLTDLYQLTMLRVYVERDMQAEAVFEFATRRLPPQRNFIVAAGLAQLLDYLETIRFSADELEWLQSKGYASGRLLDYLADFRFTGDVYAVPEGNIVFGNEPLVRVVAPLPQAQLVESRLVNLLQFQSVVATKAARCVLAAPERTLVDFGMRRAHGAEAALLAARASYLAGFAGTATVLAGRLFGIPLFGTMAHSLIEAHDTEIGAFENFARTLRNNVVLLLDTYDTIEGAKKAVELIPELAADGISIRAVRLDSGDLVALSRGVRDVLDAAGSRDVQIFASGGLNEFELERITRAAAPIDGFGVGTDLTVSSDAPHLDCAYKLQEYDGIARRKRSSGKESWPGRKQIFRRYGANGAMQGDTVGLETENLAGDGLLVPVMREGRRLGPPESLERIRHRSAASLEALPPPLRSLSGAPPYPVGISSAIRELAAEIDARTG